MLERANMKVENPGGNMLWQARGFLFPWCQWKFSFENESEESWEFIGSSSECNINFLNNFSNIRNTFFILTFHSHVLLNVITVGWYFLIIFCADEITYLKISCFWKIDLQASNQHVIGHFYLTKLLSQPRNQSYSPASHLIAPYCPFPGNYTLQFAINQALPISENVTPNGPRMGTDLPVGVGWAVSKWENEMCAEGISVASHFVF